MKLMILATLSLISAPLLANGTVPVAADSCTLCGSIQRLLNDMVATPSNPSDSRTRAKQDAIFNRATLLIPDLLKKKNINLPTSRATILLIAKVNTYSNDGTLGGDNSEAFRWHWNNVDGVFKTATKQLIDERKITKAEEQAMLEEMGVIDSPGAPKSK